MNLRLLLPAALALLSASGSAIAAESATIRFDRDIRPILSDKCFHCHGPDEENRQAELRLDVEASAKAAAIVPGDAAASEVIRRILSTDEYEVMPPPDAHKPLTAAEIRLLQQWVDQGAEYSQHWAFVPPQSPPVPQVSNPDWCRNPIDHFILKQLDEAQLQPAAAADRRTLIRRLTFDLTGLPPTLAEVQAFVQDSSDDAYEKVVDRLLSSAHYGERMALMWLDAARYGDTSVFHADGNRDMWAWRDQVVKAYNDNMPFDEFTIEQLAGDLLPEPTVEQLIASGFNRNNGTTDEGGAIAEEYRVEYAVDRVKTTATVWLGLTMECAQCHDHKYDPISQREYYQFYAFFNVSSDTGMQTRNGNAEPRIDVPDPRNQLQLPAVQEQLTAVQQQLQQRAEQAEPAFQQWTQLQETQLAAGEPRLLPRDALLHLPLDEGQGQTTASSVNPEHTAKFQGQPEWTTARFNQGLKLSGNDWLDLGNLADFERTDAFSYGGWIRPAEPLSGAVLAKLDNNNSFRGYDLLLSDGHLEVHVVNRWPEDALKVRTRQRLQPDTWQHVFATYDGSSTAAGIRIYVDGQHWEHDVQQDGLKNTIRNDKTLLVGSRHPDSKFQGTLDEIRVYPRQLNADEVGILAAASPITPILQLTADARTPEQVTQLRTFFLTNVDSAYQDLQRQQSQLQAQQKQLLEPLTSVMVMQDQAEPRDTFVLNRGAYDSPTDVKVTQGTPAVLPAMPDSAPRNRLGLARWLFTAEHPLTARVAVNRYWQLLMGTGLVATSEDFGAQGEFPRHPELLDWLAVDFRDSGWDIKRMVRQIVLSSTYRQTAAVSPDLYARDPDNRLLARGPRFRLQGEFIRDNALMISGLLNTRMGGPGVKPYQPPGLWAEVGLGGNPKFEQDHGEKLYRRSLYTYWKRSAPPPSMQIFDAPTREKCTIQRSRTNTPLQALVTLNDVQFVEASRHLAQRLLISGGDSDADRITLAFQLATARPPTDLELESLTALLQPARDHYATDEAAAKALLAVGESARDESLPPAEHAAWTIVASAILNLNETLTRG